MEYVESKSANNHDASYHDKNNDLLLHSSLLGFGNLKLVNKQNYKKRKKIMLSIFYEVIE